MAANEIRMMLMYASQHEVFNDGGIDNDAAAAADPEEDVHCSKEEDALDRSSEEENGRVVISAASITWRSSAPMSGMLLLLSVILSSYRSIKNNYGKDTISRQAKDFHFICLNQKITQIKIKITETILIPTLSSWRDRVLCASKQLPVIIKPCRANKQ